MTTIQPPATGFYPAPSANVWRKREVDGQAPNHEPPASDPDAPTPTTEHPHTYRTSTDAPAATESRDTAVAHPPVQRQEQRPRTLEGALRESDLSRALQAFRNLKQGLHDTPKVEPAVTHPETDAAPPETVDTASPSTETHPADQFGRISQDLQALKAALQAGDLSGAQRAFATFQHDLHAVGHSHDFLNVQVTVNAPTRDAEATPVAPESKAPEAAEAELDLLA